MRLGPGAAGAPAVGGLGSRALPEEGSTQSGQDGERPACQEPGSCSKPRPNPGSPVSKRGRGKASSNVGTQMATHLPWGGLPQIRRPPHQRTGIFRIQTSPLLLVTQEAERPIPRDPGEHGQGPGILRAQAQLSSFVPNTNRQLHFLIFFSFSSRGGTGTSIPHYHPAPDHPVEPGSGKSKYCPAPGVVGGRY